MTTDKLVLSQLNRDLQDAIMDVGGVECEQVPNIFFPEDYIGTTDLKTVIMTANTAREICLRCPVMAKCLKVGMFEEFGIWGGTTPEQRRQIRRNNEV
jgi:hypothetical protein